MLSHTPLNDRIGLVLSRIVVPLWILAGVVFKLHAGTASTLPSNIVNAVKPYGPEVLDATLYALIGLEIFAILVMVFLARLARPMAMFMLSVFVLILLGELAKGAESCGCFGGTVPVKPWHMLIADGLLLLGVVLFRPPVQTECSGSCPRTAGALIGAMAIGLVASFTVGNLLHGASTPGAQSDDVAADSADQEQPGDGDDAQVEQTAQPAPPRDPYVNVSPKAVPRNWYPQNLDAWPGTPWREIEIFQFMPRWPEGLDEGLHYVVFYSRTCTHCEDMFYDDLIRPLGAPVVAIQIPASRTELTGDGANVWPMPGDLDPNVTLMQLPLGADWSLMTPPLALRVENGIVRCAREGDHKECFELE